MAFIPWPSISMSSVYLSQSLLHLSPFCCFLRNSMLKRAAIEIYPAINVTCIVYKTKSSSYYLNLCRCLDKTIIPIKISSRVKLGVKLTIFLKIFQVSFLPLRDTYILSSRDRELGASRWHQDILKDRHCVIVE